MDIHNTAEDMVIAEINTLCDSLEADKKQGDICTCSQCRQDAACYVLNRIKPQYMVSHRGLARVNNELNNQNRADLTTLAYEGIRRVNHNRRPYIDHSAKKEGEASDIPVFNIPTIMGQVFSGLNFSPLTNIDVELLQNGEPVQMKDKNWQNPYSLIPSTGGVFTFWPKPVTAQEINIPKVFEFTIRINAADYAELNHVFSIPVISDSANPSFSLARTYKLPNLYLFPPGEEKNQLIINE
jgi:competence protein ComFB